MELICREALLEKLGCIPLVWEYGQAVSDIYDMVKKEPTVEPKRGRWVERRVSYVPDSDIYEMQSAKCSACGLYHTTPYQYFFKDYKFCPHCGAKMEGGENND